MRSLRRSGAEGKAGSVGQKRPAISRRHSTLLLADEDKGDRKVDCLNECHLPFASLHCIVVAVSYVHVYVLCMLLFGM